MNSTHSPVLEVLVRRFGPALLAVMALLAPRLAAAQINPILEAHHVEFHADLVKPLDVLPGRPLVLGTDKVSAYTGLSMDLSSGVAGDIWVVPFGGTFGISSSFDVGMDATIVPRPLDGASLIGTARLFGRYLLVPGELALDVGLSLPTALAGQTGLEVSAPLYVRQGSLEIFGAPRVAVYSGANRNDYYLGAALTALYDIDDHLFAVGETSLAYWTFKYPAPFQRVNNFILPLGLGAGYKINPGLFAKASFVFRDLASQDAGGSFNGLDNREFSIMIVQQLDVGSLSGSAH